jgi:hypothetical protein
VWLFQPYQQSNISRKRLRNNGTSQVSFQLRPAFSQFFPISTTELGKTHRHRVSDLPIRGSMWAVDTRSVAAASIVAERFKYCGKEFRRKLEQGPVDHNIDVKVKVYENGRVAADPEMLRLLADFSEREIALETGLHRKTIRLFRHGETVTRRTYDRIMTFLEARED